MSDPAATMPLSSSVRQARRLAALDKMADHLLAHGLQAASLRPLAAAAGTSDRMLLYYFADKDELLAATLGHLAARLMDLLDADGRAAPVPFEALLRRMRTAVRQPRLRPYLLLMIELAAAAGRAQEPHRAIGHRIADLFLDWTAERLAVAEPRKRRALAARLLATVDGLALLDAVGHGALADRAARAAPEAGEPATSATPKPRRSRGTWPASARRGPGSSA